MNNSKTPRDPVIRSISSVAEEKIYNFKRRTIFSPETAANCNIKFCTVNSVGGAKSQSHTHPGDEIVVTLRGENINYSGKKEFTLQQDQAIAIPPGKAHTTTVANNGIWKGISFYCDDCPLISGYQHKTSTDITRKSLGKITSYSADYLAKQAIFSPALNETIFMELFTLSSNKPLPAVEFTHKGDTVYYTVSGSVILSWYHNSISLELGMAAAIPAGCHHKLKIENHDGCRLIAGSCSSCPLLETK